MRTGLVPQGHSQVNRPDLPHHVLKEMGNKLFAASQFQDAVYYYTYAIEKQSNISCYYSNRALCYVQIPDYEKALVDCKRALELDDANLKAYFFAGQAHLGLGQFDEALTKLLRAHELALEQRRNFGDDITSMIRLAKRKRFESIDEKRRQEEIALQTYLNGLICQDAERQKQELLKSANISPRYASTSPAFQACSTSSAAATATPEDALKSCNVNSNSLQAYCGEPESDSVQLANKQTTSRPTPLIVTALVNGGSAGMEVGMASEPVSRLPDTIINQLQQISSVAQRRIADLNELFAQVDERRQKREVPEYLCGRISFEIMLDPVITPSGITYDRRSIIAHLRQVGHFDPISRRPLTDRQLIPNLAMKEVISAYLEENPWAETF